ncbi:anti-sigma factor [Lysinibacillus piscis]|uniref:Sigma factor regulator C-terminal domain-containing protein n=1 Tax=Lysinibacillus piscis TaxID=2518931 RepID=A0ABQ5NNB0_9BACI|nr:anti-sigma factor [Lysinibacillus sp. KH24]GLC89598.1 hypothetical protein LYSBPC_27250 [Lysinibacillus sp. KH24]
MEVSLQRALKKAKLKQLLIIIIVSLIVVTVSLAILYKAGNYFAAKGSNRLHDQLFLHNAIAEPNIQIDSQVTSNQSTFGGNIITNRSKNINGYVVPWSTLTSSYGWIKNAVDTNELVPGFYWSDTSFYEYDKQTKNKFATFFHPDIKDYFIEIPNDIEAVSTMEDYVVEMAISFDKPYTFEEIKTQIPDNLNIAWLYMTSPIFDESKGPSGAQIYGFVPSDIPADMYDEFVKNLQNYDKSKQNDAIQAFLKDNKNKSFAEIKILGVMLTGQTKNFAALKGQTFIRGASVGVTAPIVPYIKPAK